MNVGVRRWFLLVVAAAGSSAALAQASCPDNTTPQSGLATLLAGKTMCASSGSDRWQEYHHPGPAQDLIDWKLGADPKDPTKRVGRWSVGTIPKIGDTVLHTYDVWTPTVGFSWLVCAASNNTYTLVPTSTGPTITGVRLLAGQVPC